MALPDGLYDLLSLKGGAPELLVDAMTRQLGAILDDVVGDDTDKPERQLELANELLVVLRHQHPVTSP